MSTPRAAASPGYTIVVTDAGDPLEEAWKTLQEHWSEPARHEAFVALAASLERLPDAAARYRSAAEVPERAAEAERGKRLVLARALAQIDAMPRTDRALARRRGALLAPLASLGFLLTTSFALAVLTHRREFVSAPALAAEVLLIALLPWRRILR